MLCALPDHQLGQQSASGMQTQLQGLVSGFNFSFFNRQKLQQSLCRIAPPCLHPLDSKVWQSGDFCRR